MRIKSMNLDEQELIARILGGEQEEYRLLIDRYKDQLYRHCFYIVRDEDVAEDMTQEAFIKAFNRLGTYDPAKAAFKTWVYTIATRECLSYLRRKKPLPLEEDESLPSDAAATDQLARDHELYQAVMNLKPKLRTVVTLYYWHGYSYEQIASSMNVPIGSVRGWIFRAKKELKEALS
jgi:RNA polymerase sigma-70 factor (ECF subfamily)